MSPARGAAGPRAGSGPSRAVKIRGKTRSLANAFSAFGDEKGKLQMLFQFPDEDESPPPPLPAPLRIPLERNAVCFPGEGGKIPKKKEI